MKTIINLLLLTIFCIVGGVMLLMGCSVPDILFVFGCIGMLFMVFLVVAIGWAAAIVLKFLYNLSKGNQS